MKHHGLIHQMQSDQYKPVSSTEFANVLLTLTVN